MFIDEIVENQDVLVKIIRASFNNEKNYLLDGHFYLINKYKQPEQVPKGTFINLGIKKIVVLTVDINTIYTRLKSRNNYEYDLNMLQDLNNKELAYSQKIASILNVPYICIDLSVMDDKCVSNKLIDFFD